MSSVKRYNADAPALMYEAAGGYYMLFKDHAEERNSLAEKLATATALLEDLAKVCGPVRPVRVLCPHDAEHVSALHEYAKKAREALAAIRGERT